jgi:hypothetical protein
VNGQHKITAAFYFVTASHCSERMGMLEFTEQWQPGPYVGIIGEEFADEPWYYGPHPNHPSGGYPCNYAQGCKAAAAAYYAYNFARLPDLRLARPELNSINLAFPEYWWQAGLSGARNGSVGEPVTMVGSQSGRRNGYIVARCIDIGVNDFTDPSNPPRMLRCFDLASYASANGDSGAPVLLGSSPEIYSEYGVYGMHSGRWLYQGSLRAGYTPAINIRNLLRPISQDLYYCHTLAC